MAYPDESHACDGPDAGDADLGSDEGAIRLYLLDEPGPQDSGDTRATWRAAATRTAKAAITSAFTSSRVRVALDKAVVLDALRRTWPKATAGKSDAELAARIATMVPAAKAQLAGYAFEGWDAAIVNLRNRLLRNGVRIKLAPPGERDIDGWISEAGKRLGAIQHKAHTNNSTAKVGEWLGKLGKDGILRVPKDAVGEGLVGKRVKRSPVSNKDLGRAVENTAKGRPVGALAGSLQAAAEAVPIAVAIESLFGVYEVAAGNKTAEDAAEDVLWDGIVTTFVVVATTGVVTAGLGAVSPAAVPALLIALPVGFAVVPLVGVARDHIDTTTLTRPAAKVIEFIADLSPVETTAEFIDQQIVRPTKDASKAAATATAGFVEENIATPIGKTARLSADFVRGEIGPPLGRAASASAGFVHNEIVRPFDRASGRVADKVTGILRKDQAIVVDSNGIATLPF